MAFPYLTICVFCGSAGGLAASYYGAAHEMGELLAEEGITLAYGAGRTGMMGALAQGVLDHRGQVIGVLHRLEAEHASYREDLSRIEIVDDLQQRKARLGELADAFIILPGGYGTLDEFFEVLTWAQIGLHRKPIALLNTDGFYDELLAWFQRAERDRFICPEHLELFVVDSTPRGLLQKLAEFRFPADLTSWLEQGKK